MLLCLMFTVLFSFNYRYKKEFTLYNPTSMKNIKIWTSVNTYKKYKWDNFVDTFHLVVEIPQLSLCLLYIDLPCDRVSVKNAAHKLEKMFDNPNT